MRLKNPLYCYPAEADRLREYMAEGNKRGVRGQIRLISDILPKPLGDEKAERLYERQTGLTKAICITAGAEIALSAAMELCDAFLSDDDGLFLACFGMAMLGVLVIAALLLKVLSVRRRLIEYYLADYTPVCTHFDERTRELCGKALLFSSDNEELIGGGLAEDDEEGEYDFGYCFCISCGAKMRAAEVTEFSEGTAVCPKCRMTELTFGGAPDRTLQNFREYADEVRRCGGST